MMKNGTNSARGIWLVIGLFALGVLALLGLFLAPRGTMPTPTTAPTTRPELPSTVH